MSYLYDGNSLRSFRFFVFKVEILNEKKNTLNRSSYDVFIPFILLTHYYCYLIIIVITIIIIVIVIPY